MIGDNMDIAERKQIYEKRRAGYKLPAASRYYLDEYMLHLNDSPHMREACALKALWAQCPIEIFPEERIAGVVNVYEPLGFHYGGGTFINESARDALIKENDYTPEETSALLAALDEADRRRYHPADENIHTEAEQLSIRATAATSTFFASHIVPDFEKILTTGLDGYRREISHYRSLYGPEKNMFFDVMDIMLDAVVIYLERCAETASGELRMVFRHIAHKPPKTFHQALQLVWTIHMLNGSDSFGRFDSYLLPFYVNEDPDNVYELLVDFFIKIDQVNQIQNMCIGGVDKNGEGNFNELTAMVIKVTRELGYKGPNLCLFVTPEMPDEIWNEAIECIASGIGLPALSNNRIYVDTLIQNGYPLEESRGFSLAGCSQLMIPGQCNFMNDIGMFNAMKVGEIALYNGYDPVTETRAGIETGNDFDNFEDLYKALLIQLDYFINIEISLHDCDIKHRADREGYVMRTLFIRGCLEKAEYVMDGGALYNNVELEVIGITNLADHLYAIKKLVFDDKLITYLQLKDILARNWQDNENLRNKFRKAPKFGNGHDGVDTLRAELTDHIYKAFNKAPGTLGGIYVPGEVIFTAHDWTGKATGATADGRKAGDVLADSAGASQGADTNGPTALMQSVLKLPVNKYLLTSVILNLRFLPAMIREARGKEGIKWLIKGFFDQGGMQVQINICDETTLNDAQKNPDDHKSLIVRVGGYSDYFINLSKTLQDEIIKRTIHTA